MRAPVLVSIVLLGASCSGLPEAAAPTSTAPSSTTTVSPASTTTVPEALAFTDGSPPERLQINTGSTSTTVGEATPATRPASGGPVVTGPPPPTVDPRTLYVGVLGDLGFDEPVVDLVDPITRPAGAPLTGLGADPGRRAIVVKIDNSSAARPQAGIDRADVIVEEEVEWGITRLAAVFHSDGGVVGPVRSGRTTDIAVLAGLGGPGLVYSGANDVTDAVLLEDPTVINLSAARTGGYWRQSGRRAPSNLFIDLADVWAALAPGDTAPMFAIGTAPSGGVATPGFAVTYPNNAVEWAWSGTSWTRRQQNSAHVTDAGVQLSVDNVVVIETERVATGLHDSNGAVVPEFVFVGTGPAALFVDGRRIDATWTRPTLRSGVTLTGPDGTPIELAPGRTWVQLLDATTPWG